MGTLKVPNVFLCSEVLDVEWVKGVYGCLPTVEQGSDMFIMCPTCLSSSSSYPCCHSLSCRLGGLR